MYMCVCKEKTKTYTRNSQFQDQTGLVCSRTLATPPIKQMTNSDFRYPKHTV